MITEIYIYIYIYIYKIILFLFLPLLSSDNLSPSKAYPKDGEADSDTDMKDSSGATAGANAETPKSPKYALSPELTPLPLAQPPAPTSTGISSSMTSGEGSNISSSGKIQYNLEDQPEPVVAAVIKPDDRSQLNALSSNRSNSTAGSESDSDSDGSSSGSEHSSPESKTRKSRRYSRQSTSGADKKPAKEKVEVRF